MISTKSSGGVLEMMDSNLTADKGLTKASKNSWVSQRSDQKPRVVLRNPSVTINVVEVQITAIKEKDESTKRR